ncbi:MAG TPA: hypothetical protein PLN85_00695 [archaeon]|jgi:hypothetical protein|nr:hypothetical protein [archaeon]
MFNIEYDITLNENGRPCVDLSNDYENNPEDRFFAIELTRYLLEKIYVEKNDKFSENAIKHMNNTIKLLGQISDEIAKILWNNMKDKGDIAFSLNSNYHIQVENIEELYNLDMKYIYYNNKIFERKEGLTVLVLNEMKTYKLKNGILNNNWISTND